MSGGAELRRQLQRWERCPEGQSAVLELTS